MQWVEDRLKLQEDIQNIPWEKLSSMSIDTEISEEIVVDGWVTPKRKDLKTVWTNTQ